MSDDNPLMSYKGRLPDGSEYLVDIQWASEYLYARDTLIDAVTVAFREKPHHTWGPPIALERAP